MRLKKGGEYALKWIVEVWHSTLYFYFNIAAILSSVAYSITRDLEMMMFSRINGTKQQVQKRFTLVWYAILAHICKRISLFYTYLETLMQLKVNFRCFFSSLFNILLYSQIGFSSSAYYLKTVMHTTLAPSFLMKLSLQNFRWLIHQRTWTKLSLLIKSNYGFNSWNFVVKHNVYFVFERTVEKTLNKMIKFVLFNS